MVPSGMVLVLLAGLAPAEPKELVALPLNEEGVKPPAGLDAWKIVTAELKRGSTRLAMSMALQKKRHDFVIGPARERARDCGQNIECLAEIGAALGADVLVAGSVDADGVSLTAIDVRQAKKIGVARSSKKLAKTPIKRKATAAARSLVESMAGPEAIVTNPPPVASAKPPPDVPAPEPESGLVRNGELHLSKDQLAGIGEVSVDGEALLFAGDGSMSWRGAPGSHALVAVRSDGHRLTKDVQVVADQTVEVSLDFPPAVREDSVRAAAETEVEGDSVITTWWFWTTIGAAVAAGATTAALLASGAKGGPDLEGDTGTIRGRY